MQTKLILHMGMPKTGTSALQVFFAKNRDLLSLNNIIYPESSFDKEAISGKITSGNGVELANYFNPNLPHQGDFSGYLNSLKNLFKNHQGKTILFSSEFLNFNFPDRFKAFEDLLLQYDVSLTCVYYVRSVAGHSISSYSQFIKRSGYFRNFEYYIRKDLNYNFSNLKQCIDKIGVEKIKLINYDTANKNICENFATRVLLLDTIQDFFVPEETINRSLTQKELSLLRRLNLKLKSPQVSTKISNIMIYNEPDKQVKKVIAPANYNFLVKAYQKEVDFINELDNTVMLDIKTEDIKVAPLPDIKVSEAEAQLLQVIEELI